MKDKKVKLISNRNEQKNLSACVKPAGKFWKRLLHKRVRQHKLDEYLEKRIKKSNSYKYNSWFLCD